MSRLSSPLSNILLLIAAILLSIIILEMAAGYFIYTKKIDKKLLCMENLLYDKNVIGIFDKDLGWGFKPLSEYEHFNSEYNVIYSINSQGIRDKDVPLVKPEGEFRIVALGESTVFGIGIRYGKRITEVIEHAIGNTEVVNMGIRGFGIDQSFLQLQRDGFKYQPDAVVLFILIPDYIDRCNYVTHLDYFKPRFVFDVDKGGIVLQDVDFIKKHFADKRAPISLVFDKTRVKEKLSIFNIINIINFAKRRKELEDKLKENEKHLWRRLQEQLSMERRKQGRSPEEDFKKIIHMLFKKYKDLCDKNRVDFIIIYQDPHKKMDYISEYCNELGISYLDLTTIFNKAQKIKRLEYEIDPHLNESFHRLCGEFVANFLKNRFQLKSKKDFVYEFLGKL